MVTPRKPDAKRGAPPIAWADDPDRHAVALIAALDALDANSIRKSAELASMLTLAERVGEIYAFYPGLIGEIYARISGPDESSTTFEGRADSLRKKYRVAVRDPAAAQWIVVMAGIFMLLIRAKDWNKVKRESVLRASAIGEQAFVRDLILRLQPPVSQSG
jgi:hypothetical protein